MMLLSHLTGLILCIISIPWLSLKVNNFYGPRVDNFSLKLIDLNLFLIYEFHIDTFYHVVFAYLCYFSCLLYTHFSVLPLSEIMTCNFIL